MSDLYTILEYRMLSNIARLLNALNPDEALRIMTERTDLNNNQAENYLNEIRYNPLLELLVVVLSPAVHSLNLQHLIYHLSWVG
jgi:hypothetical protein